MFDMAAATMGSSHASPMSGSTGPMGSLTPTSAIKYEITSPHQNSPMTNTPVSTPNSVMSTGKSISPGKESLMLSEFGSKCKRKINFSHLGIPKGHQPATVARRNARERNRVKQVNNGFAALKAHIPLSHRSKKMSKVETLRCAVDYIRNLQDMLDLNNVLLSSNMAPSSTGSTSGSESDQSAHHFSSNGDFSALTSDIAYHHSHLANFNGSTVPPATHQLSPTSSDDPSSPSYASEASYITSSNANVYDYENYEPVSPEDEELLDAISWWQQS